MTVRGQCLGLWTGGKDLPAWRGFACQAGVKIHTHIALVPSQPLPGTEAGDDGHGGAGPAAHPDPGPHAGRDAGQGAPAEHAGRWVAHAAEQQQQQQIVLRRPQQIVLQTTSQREVRLPPHSLRGWEGHTGTPWKLKHLTASQVQYELYKVQPVHHREQGVPGERAEDNHSSTPQSYTTVLHHGSTPQFYATE